MKIKVCLLGLGLCVLPSLALAWAPCSSFKITDGRYEVVSGRPESSFAPVTLQIERKSQEDLSPEVQAAMQDPMMQAMFGKFQGGDSYVMSQVTGDPEFSKFFTAFSSFKLFEARDTVNEENWRSVKGSAEVPNTCVITWMKDGAIPENSYLIINAKDDQMEIGGDFETEVNFIIRKAKS